MTYKEFVTIFPVLDDKDGVVERIKALPTPKEVCGAKVPENLNGMTMGQLLELQGCSQEDIMVKAVPIILGVPEKRVQHEQAERVLSFNMFVARELKRIADLFASIVVPLTPLQERAGYGKLDFGPFALIDSFALRMRITDHEEVERVPWIRVFQCMKMDAEREICRRRAEEIQMQEMRNHRTTR